MKILLGRRGLDGHGAEQIAIAASDPGIEVVDEGIRSDDGKELLAASVARVQMPEDYAIRDSMSDVVGSAVAGYERAAQLRAWNGSGPVRAGLTGGRGLR